LDKILSNIEIGKLAEIKESSIYLGKPAKITTTKSYYNDSKINFKCAFPQPMKENKITTAIFIKLFATNNKSFLGLFKVLRESTFVAFVCIDSSRSF
jgi:hypothetical protein